MSTSLSDFQPLTLMLSSRCRDTFLWKDEQRPLSELREEIKREIEGIRLVSKTPKQKKRGSVSPDYELVDDIQQPGRNLFDVWIHEKETGGHSWDRCLSSSRRCDIFLALYNGNAGWDGGHGKTERLGNHVGICHAELDEAFHKSPDKVRAIRLLPLISAEPGDANARFQEYFERQNLNSPEATSGEDVIAEAKKAALAALMKLARLGIGVSGSGSYYAGEALEWTRMDFTRRRRVTVGVVAELLKGRSAESEFIDTSDSDDAAVFVQLPARPGFLVAFRCDCVPSSLTTPGARDLVGQPFLDDWNASGEWPDNVAGPVHVIACHKNVTESQAIKLLGFADAVVVSAPFGVYVADRIQCIQMVFIANCRDETSTRRGVQHFLNWLDEQGEVDRLIVRATARRRICAAIQTEQDRLGTL